MVAILVAVLIASGPLASSATAGAPVEELVFISDPTDAPAAQVAGFDGVLAGGLIRRFRLPGADQPYFDEPEALTDTAVFHQWWTQYGATGLVLHWNPAKADQRGVWQNPSVVSWNWYPANRWTPRALWTSYLPWQFVQYQAYLRAPQAYGTLQAFSGWDEAPAPGEPKPLDYYYPSDALMAMMRQQFREGLGAAFRGYLWFVWRGPTFPDSLAQHPNWWPVNRGRDSR